MKPEIFSTDNAFPSQKKKLSQKNKEWREQSVEAIISMSAFGDGGITGYGGRGSQIGTIGTQDNMMQKCYDYYNGFIHESDYTHVLKPYGKKRKNMPARLQNYPIIKPVIDLLLGEKSKRPLNYTVAVANPDAVTKKQEEKQKMLYENYMRHFIAELEASGVVVSDESEMPPPPETVAETFEGTYKDARAIIGQSAISYQIYKEEIPRKFREGFKHFLISGRTVSKHDICSDEVRYDCLNPLWVDYEKSPEIEFIEDAKWAVIHKMVTLPDVLDEFYEDLTPSQISRLENPKNTEFPTSGGFLYTTDIDNGLEFTSQPSEKLRMIEVVEVYWKSMKRLGFVTYMDDFGEIQEFEVEDNYEKQEGEEVEWYWVNEVWKGYRIDGDIYMDINPLEVQRRSLDNPSRCKLPINGRAYSDTNSQPISLVMLGIPYQLVYNIYKFRLENMVAKAKDMIAQLDIQMVPEGWTMDEYMYWIDASGIAWMDTAKEGFNLQSTYKNAIDLTAKSINDYLALIQSIESEWENLSGVNRNRKGQTSPYELKGTNEQSIIQSSHITEDYFMKFAEFEKRDLQAQLDYTKYAWINGKKGMYVMPDFTQHYMEIDGIDHMEAEYGIFVTTSGKEQEKIDTLRVFGQQMVQAGWSPSIIIELMEAENFSQIKQKIEQAEAASQQAQQAQQQAEQQQLQIAQEQEMLKLQEESRQKELDRQNKIDVALINAQESPEDNSIEYDKLRVDESLKRDEMSLEERLESRKLDLQAQKQKKDAELQKEKIEVDKKKATQTK